MFNGRGQSIATKVRQGRVLANRAALINKRAVVASAVARFAHGPDSFIAVILDFQVVNLRHKMHVPGIQLTALGRLQVQLFDGDAELLGRLSEGILFQGFVPPENLADETCFQDDDGALVVGRSLLLWQGPSLNQAGIHELVKSALELLRVVDQALYLESLSGLGVANPAIGLGKGFQDGAGPCRMQDFAVDGRKHVNYLSLFPYL